MAENDNKKVQELQLFEHTLQNLNMQKQAVQIEMNEIENALNEVKKSGSEVYKVMGNIMVKSERNSLISELEEKKKLSGMKIEAYEKQEKIVEDKIGKLRKEISALI